MFSISTAVKDSFDILFPERCLICNRKLRCRPVCFRCLPTPILNTAHTRCKRCFHPMLGIEPEVECDSCQFWPPIFRRMRYLWDYNSAAKDLISIMKYRPSPILGRFAAEQLAQALPQLFRQYDWEFVLPIPSSQASLRKRTFNQSWYLAKALHTRIADGTTQLSWNLLQHAGYKHFQASLKTAARFNNVKRAFRTKQGANLRHKRILLVDDVQTSGATANAAAVRLMQAGARSVDLICLARAVHWHTSRYAIYSRTRSLLAFDLSKKSDQY